MKKSSKLLILFFMGLFAQGAYAQVKVGDNPTTINSNSILELEATNKGLLLPRVSLSATTNPSPLSAHVAGMVVYNTATAGSDPTDVEPAYYYNDGTKWCKIDFSDIADLENEGGPVIDNTLTSPPSDPAGGDNYIVPTGATGAWSGQTNNIAEYDDDAGSWSFYTPVTGDKRIITEGTNAGNTYTFNGTAWTMTSSKKPKSPYWRLGGNFTTSRNNRLGTVNAQSLRLMTSGRDRVRVLANGNVAVGGVTAPQKLTVNGGGLIVRGRTVANAQGAQINWNQSALVGGIGGLGMTGFVNHRGSGQGGFTWVNTNNAVDFTQLMRLNTTGLIIGGTTSDVSNYKLSLGDNVANTKLALWQGSTGQSFGLGVQSGQFRFNVNSSGDKFSFMNGQAGSEIMTLTGTGNLGIGVTSPSEKLEVNGNLAIYNNALQLRGGGDNNHTLQYDWGVDGPFLKGYGGGSLGTSNGTTALHWNNSGRVGVGTVAQGHMFYVNGDAHIGSGASGLNLRVYGGIQQVGTGTLNSSGSYINWNNPSLQGGSTGAGYTNFLCHGGSTTSQGGFTFSVTNDNSTFSEFLRIQRSGNVGIGIASPSHILHISGQGRSTNSAWATTSDMRLKENIVDYKLGINELMKIHTVEYNYKPNVVGMTEEEKLKTRVGILAQELEKILPRTISTISENGLEDQRVFTADELIFLLINATQDQQKQIDELKAKLELLEKK